MSDPTSEERVRGLSEEQRDYLVILLRYPDAIIPQHVVASLAKAGLYRTPLGVAAAKCFERSAVNLYYQAAYRIGAEWGAGAVRRAWAVGWRGDYSRSDACEGILDAADSGLFYFVRLRLGADPSVTEMAAARLGAAEEAASTLDQLSTH